MLRAQHLTSLNTVCVSDRALCGCVQPTAEVQQIVSWKKSRVQRLLIDLERDNL